MIDVDAPDTTGSTPSLVQVLGVLDLVLAAAVERADARRPNAGPDPFRGLHLDAAGISRDLARRPGEPVHAIGCDAIGAALHLEPRLAALADAYALTPFEISCLVLALAPEIDARYERIYAYLQDDVTRKRPTPAFALDLFSVTTADRLQCSRCLACGATLFRERLLEVKPASTAPLLAAALVVDSQIARYLAEMPGIDPALADWCRLAATAGAAMPPWLPASEAEALETAARRSAAGRARLVLHFRGAHGTGKLQAAHALGGSADRPLLIADLRGALRGAEGFTGSMRRAVREAVLHRAVLYLRGYDALIDGGEWQALRTLSETLSCFAVPTVVAGRRRWHDAGVAPLQVAEIAFDCEDTGARAAAWRAALQRHGISDGDEDVEFLAARFRLRPAQIEAAVGAACARQQWSRMGDPGGETHPLPVGELARAARGESGHALAALARRIAPRRCWGDLVLPPQTLAVLHEIRDRVTYRQRVLADWGFDARLSLGKGVSVLLAGPSGTGKTLAAEVLAAELGLDLFRIDLSRVVSKYIGETEQNLDRVFEAAVDANAVLLFDEAEALFGKRSEVRDAHDRYANLEIAYLLQKMEEFDGLALLSTNLRQNIDEAFTRRLAFTVHFPFPEEESRTRIWEIVWPRETPRAADVDSAFLGRELVLSGGNIKNAALAAAFYAAADGGIVTRAHVLRAARREFQKMGKVPSLPEAAA